MLAFQRLTDWRKPKGPTIPSDFTGVDEGVLQAIYDAYRSVRAPHPPWPTRCPCDAAAIIRGELAYPGHIFPGTNLGIASNGSLYAMFAIVDRTALLTICWPSLIDPLVVAKNNFDPEYVGDVIPPSHNPLLPENASPSLRLREIAPIPAQHSHS